MFQDRWNHLFPHSNKHRMDFSGHAAASFKHTGSLVPTLRRFRSHGEVPCRCPVQSAVEPRSSGRCWFGSGPHIHMQNGIWEHSHGKNPLEFGKQHISPHMSTDIDFTSAKLSAFAKLSWAASRIPAAVLLAVEMGQIWHPNNHKVWCMFFTFYCKASSIV